MQDLVNIENKQESPKIQNLDQENNTSVSVEILDQSSEVKILDLGPSLEDVISEACQSSKISRRSKRIIKKKEVF